MIKIRLLIMSYLLRTSGRYYQDLILIIGVLSRIRPYNVNFITALIHINDNFLDKSRQDGQSLVCLYGTGRDTNIVRATLWYH